MFGRKKKLFRDEVVNLMFMWVPTIAERELHLFGVLMEKQINILYAKNIPSHEVALTIGGMYFTEVVRCAKAGDVEYFKYMEPYSAWLGACADHVLNKTDWLTDEFRSEVEHSLEEAKSLFLPMQKELTLSEQIDVEKRKAEYNRSAMEKMNKMRGIV